MVLSDVKVWLGSTPLSQCGAHHQLSSLSPLSFYLSLQTSILATGGRGSRHQAASGGEAQSGREEDGGEEAGWGAWQAAWESADGGEKRGEGRRVVGSEGGSGRPLPLSLAVAAAQFHRAFKNLLHDPLKRSFIHKNPHMGSVLDLDRLELALLPRLSTHLLVER